MWRYPLSKMSALIIAIKKSILEDNEYDIKMMTHCGTKCDTVVIELLLYPILMDTLKIKAAEHKRRPTFLPPAG